ncbi:MAG TPA: DUF692 family protein [Puia sp.]|uniref:DUF692 domain-containing protein n=1 Tax=Puia sp. TaxID=2045100 RepID=UPI002CD3D0FF|nr:DUF692 family multinuclear iron-containing protein [Puia sp.]HVU98718.1 DUF692 family protein [Puia sp.]
MLPEAGIGLTYNFGLQSFLEECLDHIDVLEVEPQSIWFRKNGDASNEVHGCPQLVMNEAEFERISRYQCRKLLHGIGYPVGGSIPPGDEQIPLLQKMIKDWDVPWMSEHLSFNKVIAGNRQVNTGFLLPPLQTPEGVRVAAGSIRHMSANLPIPLLIETGVNYLQRQRYEMEDGCFMASVVEAAGCGILLDLHNVLVNQKNGRQGVREFIRQIPPESVYEIHLAGGREYQGYYLDAHAGLISRELEDIAREAIRMLPNVKAVFFEIFPTYLEAMDNRALCLEMDRIRRIWDQRGTRTISKRHGAPPAQPAPAERLDGSVPSAEEWENAVAALILKKESDSPLYECLKADRGAGIMQDLLYSFRASMVVRSIPCCFRYLLIAFGKDHFESLLKDFFSGYYPEGFASVEALNFLEYLAGRPIDLKALPDLIRYESAVIRTAIDNTSRVLQFSVEPLTFLRALAEKRLPAAFIDGEFELVIEGNTEGEGDTETSRPVSELDQYNPVFHN